MNRPSPRRSITLATLVLLAALVVACSDDDGSRPTSIPTNTVEPSETPAATAIADPEAVVLSWTRAGGIAGFCDGLVLTASHRVTLGTCEDPPTSGEDGDIAPSASIIEFETWRSELASFEVEWDDGPDVTDGMAIQLSFVGRGTRIATDDERREIAAFAAKLFTDVVSALPRAALIEAAAPPLGAARTI